MRFNKVSFEELAQWRHIWRDADNMETPCVRYSSPIYLIWDDEEEEPILVMGIYRESSFQRDGFLWITVGRRIHPLHWKGLKKLLAMLREYEPNLYAIIDDTDPKNGAFARVSGMVPVEGTEKGRLYRWV